MKSEKVLDLINAGEIELLKKLLIDEITISSMNCNDKKRIKAIEKYIKNTKYEHLQCFELINDCYYLANSFSIIKFNNKPQIIESMKIKTLNDNCFNTEKIFELLETDWILKNNLEFDISKIIKDLLCNGFKNNNKWEKENYNSFIQINDMLFKPILFIETFNCINDGNYKVLINFTKNGIMIKNDIGTCYILKININNTNNYNIISYNHIEN